MRKHIIYLANDVFAKGGIQRYTRAQIKAIRNHLHNHVLEVNVLCPPQADAFETAFEVDFHGKGLSGYQKLRYSFYVIRKIALSQPGIIWSNHIRLLPVAFLGKLFSPQSHLVVNIYGLEIWSGMRILVEKALKWVDTIISDSYFTAQYVKDEFQIPSKRLNVVWDPVDTDRFQPISINRSELLNRYQIPDLQDSLCLMTLGRLSVYSRHKGYDRLIALMTDLRDKNIHLLICGDGDDKERLEKKAIDHGLSKKVFFTGSIPEDDLVDIYQLADVFVLVSDRGINRGEGVPLTPLEAAACGKPIIVGNEDGSQEAVEEGENGFIVSPADPAALKRKVIELYRDQQKRERMGEKARERILKDFSNQVFQERTLKVLKSVL